MELTIKWDLDFHLSGKGEHILVHQTEIFGKTVKRETRTKVLGDNSLGGLFVYPQVTYYIDGDKRKFYDLKDLIKVLKDN